MLKMTISKIRKICSVAIIPRILRDEFTLTTLKSNRRHFDGFWKTNKSTDSKDKDAKCEKCKKIIELVFGSEKKDPVLKSTETRIEELRLDKLQSTMIPRVPLKNKSIENSGQINDSFVSANSVKEPESVDEKQSQNIVHATTAKENKEELEQKLETVEEPVLVEAGTPKVEGFNTPPKILGEHDVKLDNRNILCIKSGSEEDPIDLIAKKCLGSPPDKVDERIIEELKRCGALGKGRRKSYSKRCRSHVDRSQKKEQDADSKAEEGMLYFEKQIPVSLLHAYPSLSFDNLMMSDDIESVYSECFKNVRIDSIRDPGLQRILDATDDQEEDRIVEVTTDDRMIIDNYFKYPLDDQDLDNETKETEETSSEKLSSSETIIIEGANTKGETQIEEIRVPEAAATSFGIFGKTDLEINGVKANKPEVLPRNQMLRATDTPITEVSFETDKREFLTFSNPTDWHHGHESSENPYNATNTAISGTYPIPKGNKEPEQKDTAISSKQNPAEFYDIYHSDMEKLDSYAINPSTTRPLEAYHPYTIISATEEVKVRNEGVTPKLPLDIPPSESSEPYNENNPGNITTLNKDVSATAGSPSQLNDEDENLSLTEMLRRVRERNRLRNTQEILQTDHVISSKCIPPLDKGSTKTVGPGPCKPKSKPPPPKCPPPCPAPCPPPRKKDPCAKFTKTDLIGGKIKETFTLVLQVGFMPAEVQSVYSGNCKIKATEPLKPLYVVSESQRIEKLGSFLLSRCPVNKEPLGTDDVALAKDYEPWTPIPSWPMPKVEKKPRFVCPKEGCKLTPPPRLNPPCKENPCADLPKRSFSVLDFIYEPLYLYNDEI